MLGVCTHTDVQALCLPLLSSSICGGSGWDAELGNDLQRFPWLFLACAPLILLSLCSEMFRSTTSVISGPKCVLITYSINYGAIS